MNTKMEGLSLKTNIDRLNSILRLRLFYSTVEELEELIGGYKLRNNKFNKFKEFQSDAYFSKFAEICNSYMRDGADLSELLEQYEATSQFYTQFVRGTVHKKDKAFLAALLDDVFLDNADLERAQNDKVRLLVEKYREKSKNGNMNIGILLLLTHGLLPTFANKTAQNVKDIIGDFQQAYDILMEIVQANKERSHIVFSEPLCLMQIRELIEEEREGGKNLNRILLISMTNDSLGRIYAQTNPRKLLENSKKHKHLNLPLQRFWQDGNSADNVVWEFIPLENAFLLYRNEIDYKNKQIRFSVYQIVFHKAEGCLETLIMRPSYVYNLVLHRELPPDSLVVDFTEIHFDMEQDVVDKLKFTLDSPIGGPMNLEAIKDESRLKYYTAYIDHIGAASDFTDVVEHPEWNVDYERVDVAVSGNAILFDFGEDIYRLDKFDADGNETIEGVASLTQQDHFFYVELEDEGRPRCFLRLDPLEKDLDVEALLEQPFFRKIEDCKDVF